MVNPYLCPYKVVSEYLNLKFNPAELICVSQWSSKCAARKTPKRDNACLYVHQDLNELGNYALQPASSARAKPSFLLLSVNNNCPLPGDSLPGSGNEIM
ncbi:hypothetical protein T4E_1391 [Trichinella pseudospiralis]|uniref:Uncharacterized protein n=1 Tax=Trichinella pseudospiralis TaxID=6337 RepID=A0A0V0XNL3_TRIPS|nr:hypothetical protein T4E_1391 [Trichinella pseudospiralis]